MNITMLRTDIFQPLLSVVGNQHEYRCWSLVWNTLLPSYLCRVRSTNSLPGLMFAACRLIVLQPTYMKSHHLEDKSFPLICSNLIIAIYKSDHQIEIAYMVGLSLFCSKLINAKYRPACLGY